MRTTASRLGALAAATLLSLSALSGCASGAPAGAAAPGAGSTSEPAAAGSTDAPATDTQTTAAIPADVCGVVTQAQVSEAVGATVTLEKGPSGDCEFSQENPRAIRGTFGAVPFARTNGGYAMYVEGLTMMMKDTQKTEISGLGKAASVYVGVITMGSGENLSAGGVVDRGDFLLQTTIVQGVGASAKELNGVSERLLRLLDGAVT